MDIDTKRRLLAWLPCTDQITVHATLTLLFTYDRDTLNPETSLNTPKAIDNTSKIYPQLILRAFLARVPVLAPSCK